MELLETILLTTDFGTGSAPAIDTSVVLAKTFQSKLVLLHVVSEPLLPLLSDDGDIADIEQRLHEVAKQIEAQGVGAPEIFLGKGIPAEVICQEAARRDANLIVIGCGARKSGGKCRPGVTAERVLRRAITPVWIARTDASPTPRRILCPTDTSRASRRALQNALVLCRRFNAKLTVLNVQEPLLPLHMPIVGVSAEKDQARLNRQQIEFDDFLAGCDFGGVDWTRKVRYGMTHKEIVAEAVELKADLLTMGTLGKTGVERILLGSVTHKILRELPCPVLTMKEADVVRLRLESAVTAIEEHFNQGQQLLERGMLAEAIREFDQCLLSGPTYAVAWEGKALAYERLGEEDKAEAARVAAKRIRETLWHRRVGGEIRGRHGLLEEERKSL
jgi:nucleotide-binding universal stress UspA family protein